MLNIHLTTQITFTFSKIKLVDLQAGEENLLTIDKTVLFNIKLIKSNCQTVRDNKITYSKKQSFVCFSRSCLDFSDCNKKFKKMSREISRELQLLISSFPASAHKMAPDKKAKTTNKQTTYLEINATNACATQKLEGLTQQQ